MTVKHINGVKVEYNTTKNTVEVAITDSSTLTATDYRNIADAIDTLNAEYYPQFKTGDVVKRTKPGEYIKTGHVDTVIDVNNHLIKLDKAGGWFYQDNFEKIV